MSKSKGLGDTVEKALRFIGAKKLVDKFTGAGGCGCNSRRKKLNKWWPYKD